MDVSSYVFNIVVLGDIYVAKCDFHNISSTFSVIHKSEIGKRTQHTIHVYYVMKVHTQCKSKMKVTWSKVWAYVCANV